MFYYCNTISYSKEPVDIEIFRGSGNSLTHTTGSDVQAWWRVELKRKSYVYYIEVVYVLKF